MQTTEQPVAAMPQRFIFNNTEVDFEVTGQQVMVNATQMAKIFDAQVIKFTQRDDTQKFIAECLKSANSHYLNIENEEDFIVSTQKTGTWMHRILALKFAAWLNPAFELWVYSAIDEILFENYREMENMLRRGAETKNRIDEIRNELRTDHRFAELEELEVLDRQYSRNRARKANSQLAVIPNP
jgi:hypothetical protein